MAQLSTDQMTGDEDAIRDLLGRTYAAWAAGAADDFVADYLHDASVVMPAVLHQGRDAVRTSMAAGFAGPLAGSRGVDQPLEIRVYGDCAVVLSRAGILFGEEKKVPAERVVHATWTLVRTDDGWRVAAYANAPAGSGPQR